MNRVIDLVCIAVVMLIVAMVLALAFPELTTQQVWVVSYLLADIKVSLLNIEAKCKN